MCWFKALIVHQVMCVLHIKQLKFLAIPGSWSIPEGSQTWTAYMICCCLTKQQNMNFILILWNLNIQIKPNMSYNPLCDFDESRASSHKDIMHRISQGGYGDSMRLYGSTPHFSALPSFHSIPLSTFSNRSNLNRALCIVFFNYLIGHDWPSLQTPIAFLVHFSQYT